MSERWQTSSHPLHRGDVVRINGTTYEVLRVRRAGAVIRSLPPGRAHELVIARESEIERRVAA